MKKIFSVIFSAAILLTVGVLAGCQPSVADNAKESYAVRSGLAAEAERIALDDEGYIRWFGRVEKDCNGAVSFNYSGSGFEVKIRGTQLDITLGTRGCLGGNDRIYVSVIQDGKEDEIQQYGVECDNKVVSVRFSAGGEHTVRLVKNNEPNAASYDARLSLNALRVEGVFLPVSQNDRLIEIYGDSITCGYGNIDNDATLHFGGYSNATEDATKTYWYLSARALNADYSVVAHSGFAVRYNPYGVESSQTSIPQLSRQKTFYNAEAYVPEKIPQAVVLNCGTNDYVYCTSGVGGNTPSEAEKEQRKTLFVQAYIDFVNELRIRYPGTHFFLTSSMMIEIASFQPLVQRVIDGLGGNDVHYLAFRHRDETFGTKVRDVGGDGHPGTLCHAANAQIMTDGIKSVLGW